MPSAEILAGPPFSGSPPLLACWKWGGQGCSTNPEREPGLSSEEFGPRSGDWKPRKDRASTGAPRITRTSTDTTSFASKWDLSLRLKSHNLEVKPPECCLEVNPPGYRYIMAIVHRYRYHHTYRCWFCWYCRKADILAAGVAGGSFTMTSPRLVAATALHCRSFCLATSFVVLAR